MTKKWIMGMIAVLAIVAVGCSKGSDEAKAGDEAKEAPPKVTSTQKMAPGTPEAPNALGEWTPPDDRTPSESMEGTYQLQPSERQKEINATLSNQGRKPLVSILTIKGTTYELVTTTERTTTTETGTAKQDGKKVSLEPDSVKIEMDGKAKEGTNKRASQFELDENGFDLKRDDGVVYTRR